MVLTVTCPSCSSAFPVDPTKIPESGVNARCSSCGQIFRVERPAAPPVMPKTSEVSPEPDEAPPAPPASAETPAVAEQAVEDAGTNPWGGTAKESVVADPDPLPRLSEAAAEPEPEPVADPVTEASPVVDPEAEPLADSFSEAASGVVRGFTFWERDPTDKAKRLARVLVSDMIMYNAERHQSALSTGTLVQDFEEEIDKSWNEYIDMVGEELANGAGRGFWTDALNSILAKGEQVF
jgi:predicted Zn finger-like uncharacterized protein